MKQITGRLENWAFVGSALYGQIYDDVLERWDNGHNIKLSKVKTPTRGLREGMVVETLNSKYLLGKKAGV